MSKLKKTKALLLFSGGLDSILAAKILKKQGIDVTALTFVSYFFDAEQAKKSLPRRQAGARENNIKLITKDISKKHFNIVKNPCYGRGAGMNPCVDCHLLMIKEAKKIVRSQKYDFIATGEVLGQRPMSQNREALKLIEKKVGLAGKILRPLSAKVLPETEIEKDGLADRKKLFGIRGRGRKEQIGLAKKFGVKYYSSPAGGCILTDGEYSKKLRELLKNVKSVKPSDIKLLRLGRHFWSGKNLPAGRQARIILGRNHKENLKIKKLAEKGDVIVEPKSFPGPTAILRGRNKKMGIKIAKEKVIEYAKKIKDKKVKFVILPVN